MENKGTKILAVVALAVAVCGVSIGFAAFSNTLTISSSAHVKPDSSKFDVNFSSTNTVETAGTVVATKNPSTEADLSGDNATIDNSGDPTITGLKANFTEPGQKVEYTFYAHNAGEYDAFLNSIVFENASGKSQPKVCTALDTTTQALVDTACEDISLTVNVGADTYKGSEATVNGHSLAKDAYEEIKVTIEYKTNAEHINIADGDFQVSFGNVTLVYGSVD